MIDRTFNSCKVTYKYALGSRSYRVSPKLGITVKTTRKYKLNKHELCSSPAKEEREREKEREREREKERKRERERERERETDRQTDRVRISRRGNEL